MADLGRRCSWPGRLYGSGRGLNTNSRNGTRLRTVHGYADTVHPATANTLPHTHAVQYSIQYNMYCKYSTVHTRTHARVGAYAHASRGDRAVAHAVVLCILLHALAEKCARRGKGISPMTPTHDSRLHGPLPPPHGPKPPPWPAASQGPPPHGPKPPPSNPTLSRKLERSISSGSSKRRQSTSIVIRTGTVWSALAILSAALRPARTALPGASSPPCLQRPRLRGTEPPNHPRSRELTRASCTVRTCSTCHTRTCKVRACVYAAK